MAVKLTAFRGAIFPSAIEDFTITPYGPAATGINAEDVREAMGYAQVDRWSDGHAEDRRIDGVPVRVRRSGWRIEFWGREDADLEAEPPPDPLPMPEGGEPFGPGGTPVERNARSLLRIADTCADGSPWPPRTSEAHAAEAGHAPRADEVNELILARKKARDLGDEELSRAIMLKINALLGL